MSLKSVPPISTFPLKMESEHFAIHYGLRNPTEGKGRGCEGVRDRVLILTYLDALERLYSVLTEKPWSRPVPIAGANKKTRVFVFDSDPYTADDPFTEGAHFQVEENSIPFIVLPSRTDETTTQAELHRAAAEAVHEATHVFNYTERPYHSLMSKHWEWFDEGFAVFIETFVVSGNPDYVRFLMNWIDMPEVPVDHKSAKYQAGMFVRYLVRRLGVGFVNDVWVKSKPREKPFETIQRLLPPDTHLISVDPDIKDLFASGYCMDPYFLWDHKSPAVAPDVFVRYGERAISESIVLKPDAPAINTDGNVDHLACRYYRLYLRGNVSGINIELTTQERSGAACLKGEIATVTSERTRKDTRSLQPKQATEPGKERLLGVSFDIEPQQVDHLVLVVSNCGTRADREDDSDHDDGQAYRVTASAY